MRTPCVNRDLEMMHRAASSSLNVGGLFRPGLCVRSLCPLDSLLLIRGDVFVHRRRPCLCLANCKNIKRNCIACGLIQGCFVVGH